MTIAMPTASELAERIGPVRVPTLSTGLHTRAFEDAELDMKDGRLTGRLVPYDQPAWVLDSLPDGRSDIYQEGFRRGAFDRLLVDAKGNAGRIKFDAGSIEFKHRHNGGLGYLGPGISLEERDDGMYGTFQIVSGKREDVADLLAAGHRGLSIEFRELPGGTVEEDEVRWRTDVRLTGTALEWRGAYSSSQVLAYRSEIEAEHADEAAAAQAEQKAAAEAAAVAAIAQKAADEVADRQRRQAEADAWVVEQERQQAELVAKYGR